MSTVSPQYTVVAWVSEETIRQAFNEGRFLERVERGELTIRLMYYDTHLSKRQREKKNGDDSTRIRFTKCTRSQMVLFLDADGKPIAKAHRYKRRDGRLAGSGMVDPKWLVVDGLLLKPRLSP